jgi:hypothetical protein
MPISFEIISCPSRRRYRRIQPDENPSLGAICGERVAKSLGGPVSQWFIRTANGNCVTAVGGGGLSSGTSQSDNLHTDATQVQAWERFRVVDQSDCTYAIQTVNAW